MRGRLWRAYGLLGSVAVCGYWLMPAGGVRDLLYLSVGLSCVLAIGAGIRLHSPTRTLPWLLMLVSQLSWVAGDGVARWMADVQQIQVYPSLADAFYLGAYPVLTAGFVLLTRQRRSQPDIAGLLDTATLTSGLALLTWVLLVSPTIGSSPSLLVSLLGIAYPAGEILIVGLLIRLVTSAGGRSPSYFFLFGAVMLLIAGDTSSMALNVWSSLSSNTFDVLWLGSYVGWGTCALHPSMHHLSEPGAGKDLSFTNRRLAALMFASLVAPGTLAVQKFSGASISVWAVVTGSVVMFLLVIGRMKIAITQITAAQAKLERLQVDLAYQASHDSLTDLPNRPEAVRLLEAALADMHRQSATRGQTLLVGVLFIDLDGFKAVNDTFGHRAGDQVLCAVANRLRDSVRTSDVVARLGGDEFMVLLKDLSSERVGIEVAERLVAAVAVPIPVEGNSFADVGASIGLAIDTGSADQEQILHEADTAAYRAKSAGRGRVEVFGAGAAKEPAQTHTWPAPPRRPSNEAQHALRDPG